MEDKINFKIPIVFTVILGLVVAGGVIGLTKINESRGRQVVAKYTQETTEYIARNKQGLVKIFTGYFPNEPCYVGNLMNSDEKCPVIDQDKMMAEVSHDLVDFSSSGYIKMGKAGYKPLFMTLAGDVSELYFYPPEKEQTIRELLAGIRKDAPWDEYVQMFQGKQVLVPVEDSGKVIGLIVRGVIEKGN